MLKWLITKLCVLIGISAYAQNVNYLATDSSLIAPVEIIQGLPKDNSQFIRIERENGEKIKYLPEQLSEYGFKTGIVYVSRSISIGKEEKQVFLKRLERGKINLYRYTAKGVNTYFLERDSTYFIELKKSKEFTKELSKYTSDMKWRAAQPRLARYNQASLSKFINFYNADKNRPLPFPRFGLLLGFNSIEIDELKLTVGNTLVPLEDRRTFTFEPTSTVSFGLFADLPINMSDFSFNLGMNLARFDFLANSETFDSDVDITIDITSINIPILLRYTLPTISWRPFFNAGGIYSYHVSNKNEIQRFRIESEVTENSEASLISKGMLGYSFGLGVERYLSYKKLASIEFRVNQLYGRQDLLNKNYLEFLMGFSF